MNATDRLYQITAERVVRGETDGTITAKKDGTFFILKDGQAQEHAYPRGESTELGAILDVRDTLLALLAAEYAGDERSADRLRDTLEMRYEEYVAVFGRLNRLVEGSKTVVDANGSPVTVPKRPNQGGFRRDAWAVAVYGLETLDQDGEFVRAAIFSRRVVSVPNRHRSAISIASGDQPRNQPLLPGKRQTPAPSRRTQQHPDRPRRPGPPGTRPRRRAP